MIHRSGFEAVKRDTVYNRDAMKDKDIDMSDIAEVLPEMFAWAVVRNGLKKIANKQQLTLRLDSDVLEWFKRQGQGYQTKINTLLRVYMDAHRH